MKRTIPSSVSLLISCVISMMMITTTAFAQQKEAVQWLESYEDAIEQSKSNHIPIVILFTGSDWCGWCKKLEKEVFQSKDFALTAGENFIFLKVDFPMYARQSAAQKAHNTKLKNQFGVKGFPTVIVLGEKQQKITSTGYQTGGGRKYADYLLKVVADYENYKAKYEGAAAASLSSTELEQLYQQAKELGQNDDLDFIIGKGIESTKPGFFLKERYLKLVDEGMIGTTEAKAVRDELLASDPQNLEGNHRRVAVIEFQRLAEELEVTDGDARVVCKPLVDYIEQWGSSDKDNLWRLQMTVAQTLLTKDHIDDALSYAENCFNSAPLPMKETVKQAISEMEQMKVTQQRS